MSIKVRIPTPLQKLTQDKEEVSAAGKTVAELVVNLEKSYPGLRERLCDEQGKLRRFINVYVNEEDIRFLKGDATPLKDGDEVSIIPAIAGGSGCGSRGVARRKGSHSDERKGNLSCSQPPRGDGWSEDEWEGAETG
ncbi:MAG: MoaD/ThiS family protein, partial [Candidatus Omnitrophica bacterium]|nr:MoaD/ThiS family protein [Candidatus Omnitrophota bacterium]